jgi:hypothetical protein
MKVRLSRTTPPAVPALAAAQSAFSANNAAPLGAESSLATYDQAKPALAKRSKFPAVGISAQPDGRVAKGAGEALEIDRRQAITFILHIEQTATRRRKVQAAPNACFATSFDGKEGKVGMAAIPVDGHARSHLARPSGRCRGPGRRAARRMVGTN